MIINLKDFSVYDSSHFPFVVFDGGKTTTNFIEQWLQEMNTLLEGSPFVLFFKTRDDNESHEDRKVRGIWLKQNKVSFQKVCKGILILITDKEQQKQSRKKLEAAEKAFGIPYIIVTSEHEARQKAKQLLA